MNKRKRLSLYIMCGLYVAAGINHFIHPVTYETIMPPYLPMHRMLINVSGVCEVCFGLLLLPAQTRTAAAWLIIILLIAIFPANVQMAVNYYQTGNRFLWIAILRLPVQLVLIRWAYAFIKNRKRKVA